MNEFSLKDNGFPPQGHSSMYIMHKFFGRKQERLINHYINKYTQKEGEIVLDPFCGSGVAIGEALRSRRKAIGIDINPVSIFITKNTLHYVSEDSILKEFNAIETDIKEEISLLYSTRCSKCGMKIPATCFSWKNSILYDKRYTCPKDGKRVENVDSSDLDHYEQRGFPSTNGIFRLKNLKPYWFPTDPLYYSDGEGFLKKERYDHIHELYTPRNLHALARLLDRIKKINPSNLQEAFLFAFSSMVHLASKMTPVRPTRPFSSSWIQPSYWFCTHFMESNVWQLFERAIKGRQGLLKAKRDLKLKIEEVEEVKTFDELKYSPTPVFFLLNSSIVQLESLPPNSIDYVITDPPYGQSIQYGELLYLWGSWLNLLEGYNIILQEEIIINHRQKKSITEYEYLLIQALKQVYIVLKPGKFCTITFHSPSLTIRNLLYRSAIQAGMLFEEVVYHPPARASAKSLLQPEGSQQGDYFFLFKKPLKSEKLSYQSITNEELEKWIVEIVKGIITKEGRPLPYNQLQNKLDPLLYKKLHEAKLLLTFNPKEVKKTLIKFVGTEFSLLETQNGKLANEKLWDIMI